MDAGDEETYHEQYRSVGFVRDLSRDFEIVVASLSEKPGQTRISKGLTGVGIPADRFFLRTLGSDLNSYYKPDCIILRLPHQGVLEMAADSQTPTFPCLADVFRATTPSELLSRQGIRNWRMNWRMRAAFSQPNVVAVGNHSLTASRSLNTVLGVADRRITPWEWSKIPVATTAKVHPGQDRPLQLLYVGTLSDEKGVGDLLSAFRHLQHTRPGRLALTMAGGGPLLDLARHFAQEEASAGLLTVLGPIAKRQVRELMATTDVIVVPSRPSYAEGLPNAIVEGMAYRTPLVVAEHPSTAKRLKHEHAVLFSRPLDPDDLARQIARLHDDADLFRRLSENSETNYHRLFFGSSWYTLIEAFVSDPRNKSGWVQRHSLATLDARENDVDA